MPRYEVIARIRSAAEPADIWPLLTDLPRWVSGREVTLTTEVVAEDPPRELRYRIVAGLPVRDHEACVRLLPVGGGTDIVWSHTFAARIPGTGGFLRGRLEGQAVRSARLLAEASTSLR